MPPKQSQNIDRGEKPFGLTHKGLVRGITGEIWRMRKKMTKAWRSKVTGNSG